MILFYVFCFFLSSYFFSSTLLLLILLFFFNDLFQRNSTEYMSIFNFKIKKKTRRRKSTRKLIIRYDFFIMKPEIRLAYERNVTTRTRTKTTTSKIKLLNKKKAFIHQHDLI